MKPRFAPPIIYMDDWNIYLEWPNYAERFPICEGAFAKVIKRLPHVPSMPGTLTGGSNIASKLLERRAAKVVGRRRQRAANATDAERVAADEFLKRMMVRKQ